MAATLILLALVGSTACTARMLDSGNGLVNNGRDMLNIEFDSLSVPIGLQRHLVRTSDKASVDGTEVVTMYKVLGRSGDVAGGEFGRQMNIDMEPMFDKDGVPMVANSEDFTSLIHFEGNTLWSVAHFESIPSSPYFTKLTQDPVSGELSVEKTEAMDFSRYNGAWNPCAGSVSPWKTHLGSEEYEPDARLFEESSPADLLANEEVTGMLHYMKVKNLPENPELVAEADIYANFFPYLYGYVWEAKVDPKAETYSVVKHFTMGRVAHELAYVLPDNKTAYIGDDGSNRVFTKFVASKAGDMSKGTLYAAKFTQLDSSAPGGAFDIKWISLGEASDDELEPIAKTTKFADIFDTAEADISGTGPVCPAGFKSVNVGDYGCQCLSLKPGMAKIASRFETRRYAAYLGATTEFSKWEGITYDASRNRLYTAMSEIRYGMEDNKAKGEADIEKDIGGNNDVRLPYNPCGCVYIVDLDDMYSATHMEALECGVKNPKYVELEDGAPPVKGQDNMIKYNNFCTLNGLANPDNIVYVPGHDGIVIGEDTVGGHQNDVMWYYDFRTETRTRFFSTPYGSETTSPYWYPDINGHAYMLGVVQHPYEESDEEKISQKANTGMASWVGYLGPFPVHQCAKRYAQCDGSSDFHGPYCCRGTDACVKSDDYYSSCQPTMPATGVVAWWGQCGGKGYSGDSMCEEDSKCTELNEYYSQCVPV